MFKTPYIKFFCLPNALAADAVAISLCWQAVFASASGVNVHFATANVLGLSVWLIYMADRLFDVAKRPMTQLHSVRHRFAKKHSQTLWKIWIGTLIINVGIAFIGLTKLQFFKGLILLMVCLAYTGLNQKSSSRFFPKELCVAIIYTAGVIVFLPLDQGLWMPFWILMLICLINCLMISSREKQVDIAMNMNSMAQFIPKLLPALYISCSLLLSLAGKQWFLSFGSSLVVLGLIQICKNKLSVEFFRILADLALLVGPLIFFGLLF